MSDKDKSKYKDYQIIPIIIQLNWASFHVGILRNDGWLLTLYFKYEEQHHSSNTFLLIESSSKSAFLFYWNLRAFLLNDAAILFNCSRVVKWIGSRVKTNRYVNCCKTFQTIKVVIIYNFLRFWVFSFSITPCSYWLHACRNFRKISFYACKPCFTRQITFSVNCTELQHSSCREFQVSRKLKAHTHTHTSLVTAVV